jgi:hypothetical protein
MKLVYVRVRDNHPAENRCLLDHIFDAGQKIGGRVGLGEPWYLLRAEGLLKAMRPRRLAELTPAAIDG